MVLDDLSGRVIGCAIEVHRELGPGLLESTYEHCLAHELIRKGIAVHQQFPVPVTYKGSSLDCGYRIDLLVEDSLIVELKCVDELRPIHQAQIMTYLRLTGIRLGLLINFNVRQLTDGIQRVAVGYKDSKRSQNTQ